jgi:hypothetical protein
MNLLGNLETNWGRGGWGCWTDGDYSEESVMFSLPPGLLANNRRLGRVLLLETYSAKGKMNGR